MSLPTAEAYYNAIQDPANLALPMLRFMKLTRNAEGTGPFYGKGAFGIVFRFEKGRWCGGACRKMLHETARGAYRPV
jgi:hypothetical protein